MKLKLDRILARVAAMFALVFLLPMLVVIAIAVKLSSPGPIFFRRRRFKADGTIYTVWVFRTMKAVRDMYDADVSRHDIDPRLTPVGLFLRKTHLDELPVLFAIVFGDSSFLDYEAKDVSVYTTIVARLIARRLCLIFGFLSFGGVYFQLSKSPSDSVIFVSIFIVVCLLLDACIVYYRYNKRIYGNSAQELYELLEYLESHKPDRSSGGQNASLYPAAKQEEVAAETTLVTGHA